MTNHQLPRHGRLCRVLAPSVLLLACGEAQDPSEGSRRPLAASPVAAAIELGATPLAMDDRGVPHLLRASHVAPAPAATALESALRHVGQLAAAWGVADAALPELHGIGEVPAPGATIARVRQSIDGLPVEGGELRVLVRDGGELVATSGALVSADTPRQAAIFPIDDAQAVARAVAHNYKRDFNAAALAPRELRADGTRTIRGRDGNLDVQLARARQAWHHTGAALIPVWIVEAYAGDASSTNGDAFRTVLSADGARVISHESLVADAAFSYRVFAETTGELRPMDGPVADFSPHPTGTPDGQFPAYTAPALVTVEGLNHPAGRAAPDPWLLSTRTETLGNNVEAYTDLNAPSGLSFGDFRATLTDASTRTFDRAYDLSVGPLTSQAQQMAAITSAFYGINWLHDFWYDAGFTEAAGNGQDDNYGRGGEDRDAMLAETQDNALGGSLNNANMATPADGLPPRMQIFVWSGKETRSLTIRPANRTPAVGTASFGPTAFDVAAPIVLAVDPDAPNVNDGCTPLTNDVAGQLVLVDRGNCTYKTKALNIQNAGGAGMIVANNVASTSPPGMANDTMITTPITIGALSVTLDEGNQLKAELAGDPISGVAHRFVEHQLDGSLEATLLAHEFGHYLHHRLQDCNTRWCSAISEGWGDFLALMLMVREGDNYDGAYPFSIYTTQSFTTDPGYFGIRRAPYSVNPAINSLSYRHMADGEPLPTSHPFLASGNNAEVHNAGEVWAQTMWEVYAALLKVPGASFTQVRAKMAKYVVSGLLLAPRNATPTETRDAILSVATPADREIMMAAFARRGMGSCAVTPGRDSTDFKGIVESTAVSGRSIVGSLGFDQVDSCDRDDVLDAGETAMITLPIANQGHEPIEDVKVTVSAENPFIHVVSGPRTIASLAPGASDTIAIQVAIDKDATGMIEGNFAVKIETTHDCMEVREVPFKVRLNTDDLPDSSATDAFDATSVWRPSGSTSRLWRQITETALDRAWHGDDTSAVSDIKLESPSVTVSATAPLKVTFTHRYEFEFSEDKAWDGGVIELSTDNGATWLDVSRIADVQPGYSHMLRAGDGNPLGGRMGYGSKNPAYPATDTVTLDFGTHLAGLTVKLRFRIGTDGAVGAAGWDIDDVVFEGITNKPFPTQVEDRTAGCGDRPPLPPVDELPGCCAAGPMRGSNLALAFGLLALLLRRRRR